MYPLNMNMLLEIVKLAHCAGEAIMTIYSGDEIDTTYKADSSPLTLADLKSHQIIIASLQKLTPKIPILSEEAATIPYSTRRLWTYYWLIDPLDGTKEFIKRNGEFTVNIALIKDGIPIIGVVYAPAIKVCYYAAKEVGAFVQRNNDIAAPIEVKPHVIDKTIKVVTSRSHSDTRTTALLEKLGAYEAISMGSSLKFCLVAEGKAHLYIRLGPTMEWDTAAAHAIVNIAGGLICDFTGHELHYNKEDLHNPEFFVLPEANTSLHKLIQASINP
ncbi:3'-5'-bisphosphate nucleotidase [Achromatium sp. WMS3]|nr:3'-5'-bisphosphate nucleotidase [Achromatium sp. WMS3]